MKKLIILGAALAALHASLDAQSLTVTAPGFSDAKLFDSTPGFTITGIAADTNGDIYYLETDSTNFSADTELYKRTAASGYAAPSAPLFDLGAPVFGSFVTLGGGKVFFGESSTNKVYAINPDGSGSSTLGTIVNNFDAVYSGGSLFVSHNPDTTFTHPHGLVSKYDLIPNGGSLTLGTEDTIVDTASDYSGPVKIDANGTLYYGASGANGIDDLYHFSAAEVAGAFGPTSLTLDGAHRLIANGTNAALAVGEGSMLWQSDYSTLSLIDTSTGTATAVAATPDSQAQLDAVGDEVFANVTDYATSQSAVFGVVPEPGSAALLVGALGMMSLRRRRACGNLRP